MNARVANLTHELRPTPGTSEQNITIDNTVRSIGPLQKTTTHVLLSLDASAVYVTFDGTDPEPDVGHLLQPNSSFVWRKEMALAARWVRENGGNGRLTVTELTY